MDQTRASLSRRELVSAGTAFALTSGRVEPSFEAAPPRNPVVRLVTISQDELRGRPDREVLEATMARLGQAASFQPAIACLPELAVRGPAEPVPGPSTERLAAWARSHSCYVLFGLKTLAGGKIHNSAVLLDRAGRVVGQYDKMHPTETELAGGVVPGNTEVPIFQTDFGPIGIQICFDVNWWDNWKRLKSKGAKIIFFPAAYPAARQIGALALMNQCYVVSSTQRGPSSIYDITGGVLASSGYYRHWAAAVLPLGKRLFEIDFHIEKMRQIEAKYGSKVQITWLHDDDWVTLASLDRDLTVEDLIAEFGLTPLDDYRTRADKAVRRALPGSAK